MYSLCRATLVEIDPLVFLLAHVCDTGTLSRPQSDVPLRHAYVDLHVEHSMRLAMRWQGSVEQCAGRHTGMQLTSESLTAE